MNYPQGTYTDIDQQWLCQMTSENVVTEHDFSCETIKIISS